MTYIIAEVGGNHNGDFKTALELIQSAKQCGADAVKFQIYEADKLVHGTALALKQAVGYKKQVDRFTDLQFTYDQWMQIIVRCHTTGIDFMATCFDLETLNQYEPYMPMIKIASGDITYRSLIRLANTYNKQVILSTGMTSYDELHQYTRWVNHSKLIVMHCVSSYPCSDEHVNIDAITALASKYKTVGYSDHSKGITACIAAVALGAKLIEKHFTLDNKQEFGDHPLSADSTELAELVRHVRRIDDMRGDSKPSNSEYSNIAHFRRGAYSARDIKKGDIFTHANVAVLRPATLNLPHEYIGAIAKQDFKKGDSLDGT